MSNAPVEQPFFQVGLLVKDLDAARDELGRAVGLEWGETLVREAGEWSMRTCFSLQGPPYVELIEGPPGSPWDPGELPHIDHIGFWALDIPLAKERLEREGLELEIDGSALGSAVPFSYHRSRAAGVRIELIDDSARAAFYERWQLVDPRSARP